MKQDISGYFAKGSGSIALLDTTLVSQSSDLITHHVVRSIPAHEVIIKISSNPPFVVSRDLHHRSFLLAEEIAVKTIINVGASSLHTSCMKLSETCMILDTTDLQSSQCLLDEL